MWRNSNAFHAGTLLEGLEDFDAFIFGKFTVILEGTQKESWAKTRGSFARSRSQNPQTASEIEELSLLLLLSLGMMTKRVLTEVHLTGVR
jgi:hypothetical protein